MSLTAVNPTCAIRDGDISQYTLPQNELLNHSWMKHTPNDFKHHFETKSLQNLIHSNSESRARSDRNKIKFLKIHWSEIRD